MKNFTVIIRWEHIESEKVKRCQIYHCRYY